MPRALKSAMWRMLEDDEQAYELGLVDHGCKNHLWAPYALIESSSREFLPGRRDWLRHIHDQSRPLVGLLPGKFREETREGRVLVALESWSAQRWRCEQRKGRRKWTKTLPHEDGHSR